MSKQPKISPPVGYNTQREPRKAQSNYYCILAGIEAKMPCNECASPKGCTQGTMRYKESENMEYEEKVVVQVDDKGDLLKCAKEYGASDCGYKSDTKICGKCGAMATAVKMVPLDDDAGEETDMPEKAHRTRKPEKPAASGMPMEEEGGAPPEAGPPPGPPTEAPPEAGPPPGPPEEAPPPAASPPPPAPRLEEAPAEAPPAPEEEMPPPRRVPPRPPLEEEEEQKGAVEDEKLDIEEDTEEVFDEDGNPIGDSKKYGPNWSEEDEKTYASYRQRRLESMGVKSDELGNKAYVCAIERKAYPGGSPVCDDCPGGCMAEKGMPGLLEIEGMVEKEFDSEIIDSGYSQDADMFVLDLATKDDRAIEVFVDGSNAEILGYHRLDDSVLEHKTAEGHTVEYIGYNDAADIATKSIPGEIASVEPDVFEGFDCFAVEVDGVDGKSYDVFVSLDGEILGHDIYEADEADDIEAEAAEIALKRAFTEERRDEMAGSGQALPDGSYPIESEGDLKNAIQAFGRAKDKAAAKRHIMKRAKTLGLTKLIPANWVAGGEKAVQLDVDDDDFLSSLIEFQLMNEDAEDSN